MTILDRYVFLLFVKIFVICFVSFVGLFMVIDVFTNLEEFIVLGKTQGGILATTSAYYGPRVLQFFDRTCPMIALVAGIFALTLLQRSNELIAIQAAGVSKRRIARPVFVATCAVIALSIANREMMIPRYQSQLTVNPQDLIGAKERSVHYSVDHQSRIGIRGKVAKPAERLIIGPEFLLPNEMAGERTEIRAKTAVHHDADENHPAGFWLSGVAPEDQFANSYELEGRPLIFSPSDHRWLRRDELFIASTIDVQQLAFGPNLARYASLTEMVQMSHYPTSHFSNRHRVELHGRVVQPVFDLTVLLIGLPLVVARRERNLFLSAGMCLLIVILMTLAVTACHALGAGRLIHPPALAAWLPIIIFVPLAGVTIPLLDR